MRNLLKHILAPVLVLGIGALADAQNSEERTASVVAPEPAARMELTLTDAILTGLSNNTSLKVQRLAPEIQRAGEDIQRGAFDVNLRADLSDGKADLAQRAATSSGVTNVSNHGLAGEVSLSKTFSTGTKIELQADAVEDNSSLYTDQLVTSRGGALITQPLLRGGWRGVNMVSLRKAILDTRISEFELRGFTEALVGRIEETYWDYALALRQVEAVKEAVKVAEDQLADTAARIDVGKLAAVEGAAARAESAARRQDLVSAESGRDRTRLAFLQLLNLRTTNRWEQQITLLSVAEMPAAVVSNADSHVIVALRNRADINEARLRQERGELEIAKTRNGLLPKLDVFLNIGSSGYAGSFSDAAGNVNGDYRDYTAGVTFELPVANMDARARHRQARLSLEQTREAQRNLEELAEMEVRSICSELGRAAESVKAARATMGLREEVLRREREKLAVGKSTSLLVAQAQRDALSSKLQEAQAVVQCLKLWASLYRAEGTLLERRNLTVPAAESGVVSGCRSWQGQ